MQLNQQFLWFNNENNYRNRYFDCSDVDEGKGTLIFLSLDPRFWFQEDVGL